jgi:hypothetical protein
MFTCGTPIKKSMYNIITLTKFQFIDLLFKQVKKNNLHSLQSQLIIFKFSLGNFFCDSPEV